MLKSGMVQGRDTGQFLRRPAAMPVRALDQPRPIFFSNPLDFFLIFCYFLGCTILLFSEGDFYALMRFALKEGVC